MPSSTPRASSASTLTALHDWIRASPYRTGFALSVFVALFVASTGASLLSVPAVFLGSLPVTVLLAFAHEVALRRLRDDEADRLRRSDGASRPSSVSVPEDASPDEIDGAMARLRERYAAGEIDEDEFERKVDRLLATESPATARRERRRLRQADRASALAGEQGVVDEGAPTSAGEPQATATTSDARRSAATGTGDGSESDFDFESGPGSGSGSRSASRSGSTGSTSGTGDAVERS